MIALKELERETRGERDREGEREREREVGREGEKEKLWTATIHSHIHTQYSFGTRWK